MKGMTLSTTFEPAAAISGDVQVPENRWLGWLSYGSHQIERHQAGSLLRGSNSNSHD